MATPHTPGQKHAPGTRVVYKNGVEAVVQADGRHRIVSSSAAAAANARKTPRYSKALGPRGAARAFNAYYRSKSYKSPRAKKAAMTRDLCHGRKAKYVRRTTAYKATRKGRLTGPGHYDYPGVDDGSRCPQRGGKRSPKKRGRKSKGKCGMNPATNRCARGHPNTQGWCMMSNRGKSKKGTRKSPNTRRRCTSVYGARQFLGMPKAKKSPKSPRRSKRKSGRKPKGFYKN